MHCWESNHLVFDKVEEVQQLPSLWSVCVLLLVCWDAFKTSESCSSQTVGGLVEVQAAKRASPYLIMLAP